MKTEPYTAKELEVELKRHEGGMRIGVDSPNSRILATLQKLLADNESVVAARDRIEAVMRHPFFAQPHVEVVDLGEFAKDLAEAKAKEAVGEPLLAPVQRVPLAEVEKKYPNAPASVSVPSGGES